MSTAHNDLFADLAAQYIEATLGVPVERWDQRGRQGAHDLRYEHGGRSLAVEVKCVVDEDFREMDAAIAKREYVPVDRLKRLWDARLSSTANVKSIRKDLPDLLVGLEKIGWDSIDQPRTRREQLPEDVDDRLNKLGVSVSPIYYEGEKRGFILQPQSRWRFGEDDLSELVDFASDYLAGNDRPVVRLREQLRNASADERQAFLFVGWEHTASWPLMGRIPERSRLALPSKTPTLPEPINGLWLASLSANTRVIAWLPGDGWIEGATKP